MPLEIKVTDNSALVLAELQDRISIALEAVGTQAEH